jgi:hypothetical protein
MARAQRASETLSSADLPTIEEALVRAQSGYRSDVAALAGVLAQADLYVALVEDSEPGDGPEILEPGASLKLHTVVDETTGSTWTAIFSSPETLGRAGEELNWETAGGPLQFLAANGVELIKSVLTPALESGATSGIVFDAGQESELAMSADETLSMIGGEPIPLVAYASRQPAHGTEQIQVGEPAVPPPAALTAAIVRVLDRVTEVRSYRLIQVFVSERDVTSHLMLDIVGDMPEPKEREISAAIGAAIEGISLPPPGYLDVVFNFEDG